MWGFTTDSLKKTKKAKSQNAIVDQKVALQKENTLLTKALLDYQFKFQEIKKKKKTRWLQKSDSGACFPKETHEIKQIPVVICMWRASKLMKKVGPIQSASQLVMISTCKMKI